MTTLDFKVRRLLGDIVVGLFESPQLEILNSQLIQLRSLRF